MINKKIYNKLRLIYGDKLVGLSVDKRYSEISIVKNIDNNTDLLAVLKEEEKLAIINCNGEVVAKKVRYDTWRYTLDGSDAVLLKTGKGILIDIASDEVIIDTDGNVVFKGVSRLYGKIEASDKSDINIGRYKVVSKYEITNSRNPAGAHINYTIDFESKEQYAEFIGMHHNALDYSGKFEAFRIVDTSGNKLLLTNDNKIIPDIEGAEDYKDMSADVRHIFGERVIDFYRHIMVRKDSIRALYLSADCKKKVNIKYNKDNESVGNQERDISRITIGKIFRQIEEDKYIVDSVICRDVDVYKNNEYSGNAEMLRFTKDSIESINSYTIDSAYKTIGARRMTLEIKALINGRDYNTFEIVIYVIE